MSIFELLMTNARYPIRVGLTRVIVANTIYIRINDSDDICSY